MIGEIIILLGWIGTILYGAKILKSDISKSTLSNENSLVLRGISSIEIMLGHIGLATGGVILYPNRKAGILFVGIFFALSGYGLMYSKDTKTDYFNKFIPKRVKRVLIPAYIVYALIIIYRTFQYNAVNQLVNLVNIKFFFLETNWYVWEIILFYIVFYICSRKGRGSNSIEHCILFFSIIFILIAFLLKVDNPWYGSTLCFWVGIWYYNHRRWFEQKVIVHHYILGIVLGGVIVVTSILLFFLFGEHSIIGTLVARNVAAVFFVLTIIALLYKIQIGNKITMWLGAHSYEIYLFHLGFVGILQEYIDNPNIYAVCVVVFTLVASYIYKKCQILCNVL